MAEKWLIDRLVEEGALIKDQKPMNSAFAWAFENIYQGSILQVPGGEEMLKNPIGGKGFNCKVFPNVAFYNGMAFQSNGEIYSAIIVRGARFSRLDAVGILNSDEGELMTDFKDKSEWYLAGGNFYDYFRNCFFPHMAVK